MSRKILYLTPSGENLPSVRHRVLPFIERGRDRGLDIEFRRIPKSINKRLLFFMGLPKVHAFIIQQKLFSAWELALLKRKCGLLVYDFDDAIWCLPTHALKTRKGQKKQEKYTRRFGHQCSVADICIVGNKYLEEQALKYTTKDRIRIMPTGLDMELYHPASERPTDFRVGWIGSAGNLPYVELVLREMVETGGAHELYVVSPVPYEGLHSEHVDWDKWTPENDVPGIQRMAVGLMPLHDDEFTRGKCGGKVVCYMSCGVVPLASAVGANNEIIDHGENGFLIHEPADWHKYIKILEEDPLLRERMSKAARRKMEQYFSADILAENLWSILEV